MGETSSWYYLISYNHDHGKVNMTAIKGTLEQLCVPRIILDFLGPKKSAHV